MALDLNELAKFCDEPLRESIRELRRGYQSIVESLEQSTAQCEARDAELAECRRQLAEAERTLADRQLQANERRETQASDSRKQAALQEQLAAKQAELQQAIERHQEFEAQRLHATERLDAELAHNRQLQSQLEQLMVDRELAREQLSKLHERLTPLDGLEHLATQVAQLSTIAAAGEQVTQGLAALQAELTRSRDTDPITSLEAAVREEITAAGSERKQFNKQLAQLREQLSALADKAAAAPANGPESAAIAAELSRLSERIAASPLESQLQDGFAAASEERKELHACLALLHGELEPLGESTATAAKLAEALAAVEAELARIREQEPRATAESALGEQLAAALAERPQWEAALAELREQLLPLGATAATVAELREGLAAARAEVAQLNQATAGSSSHDDLAEQLAASAAERQRLEQAVGRLAKQIEPLGEATANAVRLGEQLAAVEAEANQRRDNAQDPSLHAALLEQFALVRSDRTQWESALGDLRGQLAPMAEAAGAVVELRAELAAARAELTHLRSPGDANESAAAIAQQVVATTRADSERWLSALQDLGGQLAPLRETALGVSELRDELAAARAAVERLHERPAGPDKEVGANHGESADATRQLLDDHFARLAEQLDSLGEVAASTVQLRDELAAARAELTRVREQPAGDALESELRQELAAASTERAQLKSDVAQLTEQLAPLTEAALAAAQLHGKLTTAQRELARLREQASGGPAQEDLRAQLTAARNERQQLESSLNLLREQMTSLTASAVDAAETRGALAAAQAELTRLREQPATPSGEAQVREELTAAVAERQQLNTELDLLRQRAAELAECVDGQKRQMSEERQRWNDELRQLRRAVERQAEVIGRRPRRNASAATVDTVSMHAADTKRGDPVVDTVREQFEALQKSKARGLSSSSA